MKDEVICFESGVPAFIKPNTGLILAEAAYHSWEAAIKKNISAEDAKREFMKACSALFDEVVLHSRAAGGEAA